MNTNSRGLINFCRNIQPLMLKLHNAKKPITLTQAEMHQISQFYLEVMDTIMQGGMSEPTDNICGEHE